MNEELTVNQPKRKTVWTVLKDIIVKPYLVFEFLFRAALILLIVYEVGTRLFIWFLTTAANWPTDLGQINW